MPIHSVSPSPWPPLSTLSTWVSLFWKFHTNGIIQYFWSLCLLRNCASGHKGNPLGPGQTQLPLRPACTPQGTCMASRFLTVGGRGAPLAPGAPSVTTRALRVQLPSRHPFPVPMQKGCCGYCALGAQPALLAPGLGGSAPASCPRLGSQVLQSPLGKLRQEEEEEEAEAGKPDQFLLPFRPLPEAEQRKRGGPGLAESTPSSASGSTSLAGAQI